MTMIKGWPISTEFDGACVNGIIALYITIIVQLAGIITNVLK